MSVTMEPHVLDIRDNGDDWSGVTSPEERKKRQNRLNQRAKRRRDAENAPPPTVSAKGQMRFRISKNAQANQQSLKPINDNPERIIESKQLLLSTTPATNTKTGRDFPSWVPVSKTAKEVFRQNAPDIFLPLSSDHLLHLVQMNIYRAMITNKHILTAKAISYRVSDPMMPPFTALCDGMCILTYGPQTFTLPRSLLPTRIQQTVPHSPWMNMFPCPKMRDNLITSAEIFDHIDFFADIIGELFPTNGREYGNYTDNPLYEYTFYSSSASPLVQSMTKPSSSLQTADDDPFTSERNGFILWGDPWDLKNWELTPRFAKKWAQLLDGCNEMIASSDKWRESRGEQPLSLLLSLP